MFFDWLKSEMNMFQFTLDWAIKMDNNLGSFTDRFKVPHSDTFHAEIPARTEAFKRTSTRLKPNHFKTGAPQHGSRSKTGTDFLLQHSFGG